MLLIIMNLSPEEEDLLNRRAEAAVQSLRESQNRFRLATTADSCARQLYDEAVLSLETESDDWEVAHAAVQKLERIEQEFIEAAPLKSQSRKRLEWELGEARRLKIIT